MPYQGVSFLVIGLSVPVITVWARYSDRDNELRFVSLLFMVLSSKDYLISWGLILGVVGLVVLDGGAGFFAENALPWAWIFPYSILLGSMVLSTLMAVALGVIGLLLLIVSKGDWSGLRTSLYEIWALPILLKSRCDHEAATAAGRELDRVEPIVGVSMTVHLLGLAFMVVPFGYALWYVWVYYVAKRIFVGNPPGGGRRVRSTGRVVAGGSIPLGNVANRLRCIRKRSGTCSSGAPASK